MKKEKHFIKQNFVFMLSRIKKNLVIGFSKRAGRNFFGRKTVFTQSGGVFTKLRIIDFFRLLNRKGVVLSVEKDVKRTGYIGLIMFENGFFSYILLSSTMQKVGSIINGFNIGNFFNSSKFLMNISTGNFVHHIEKIPGSGAIFVRSAGCSSFLISEDDNFSFVKMQSGWLLKLSKFNIGVIGTVSNIDHQTNRVKNAGKNRLLGVRPKVRGVAMNPCDHPHGGGEGTGSPPSAHKTPWGKLTKVPTLRKKKYLLKKKLFKIYD